MATRRHELEQRERHGLLEPFGQRVDSDVYREPGPVARFIRRRDPPKGNFGRMFDRRKKQPGDDAAIDELVKLMKSRDRSPSPTNNVRIPAGFTYLGQFIDHDITFDPGGKPDPPLAEKARVDGAHDPVRRLVNFRTPRLDLDSLYGADRAVHPFLYDWKESEPAGARLLVGRNAVDGTIDLPRNQQGRALIGDARNDENVIVSQLHLLFIRFHNAVVDELERRRQGESDDDLFSEAQKLVRWHYQWIVGHEFLPLVVGNKVAEEVFPLPPDGQPQRVHLGHFKWRREPFIPVEFSGAAYRFGHSMVRNQYRIKSSRKGRVKGQEKALRRRGRNLVPDLMGLDWLSDDLVIDWDRFFKIPEVENPPQASFTIDTAIARPLLNLPDGRGALPERNLKTGVRLELLSGQQVVEKMDMRKHKLPDDALLLDDQIPRDVHDRLLGDTPLWYYLLCEAAHCSEGVHLGPVGGRIVAEVLAGLLQGDPTSFVRREPEWRPTELNTGGRFEMADLIRIAEEGVT